MPPNQVRNAIMVAYSICPAHRVRPVRLHPYGRQVDINIVVSRQVNMDRVATNSCGVTTSARVAESTHMPGMPNIACVAAVANMTSANEPKRDGRQCEYQPKQEHRQK